METLKEMIREILIEEVSQESLKSKKIFIDTSIDKWSTESRVRSYALSKPWIGNLVAVAEAKGSLHTIHFFDLKPDREPTVRNIILKEGEVIFRYMTKNSISGDIVPFAKVNIFKGILYPLTEESFSGVIDKIEFEKKGVKLKHLRLLASFAAKYGIV